MPFDGFARSQGATLQVQCIRSSNVLQNGYGNMPALHVSIVRGVQDRILVCRQFHVFHVELSRREKSWRATARRDCIQMVSAVLLGAKNNAPAFGKLQRL